MENQEQKKPFITKWMIVCIELIVMLLIIYMVTLASNHDLKAKQKALDECNDYIKDYRIGYVPSTIPKSSFDSSQISNIILNSSVTKE